MKKFTFIRFIEPAEREEIGIGHYGEGERALGVSGGWKGWNTHAGREGQEAAPRPAAGSGGREGGRR